MVSLIERRESSFAPWARRLASFSAVLLVVSVIGHRAQLVETMAFFWLLGLVAALATAALLCAAMGFRQLWEHGDRGGRQSTYATLLALVVLAPFLLVAWRAATLPALFDISTDPLDPPRFSELLDDRGPFANVIRQISAENAQQQLARYPAVTGRRYETTPDRVIEAVTRLVESNGWDLRSRPQIPMAGPETTIEALARSLLLGLPADVAIRVTDEGGSTYVDMRSASRYGAHDLGANAARIRDFLLELDGEVAADVGR